MATTHSSSDSGRRQPAARGAKLVSSGGTRNLNAIELLKSDHRQVERWFADYASAGSPDEKQQLATSICHALTVHTQLEEELFYPAFLETVGDEDLYDEAVQEHDEATVVIGEIEALSASNDVATLDEKIAELQEMIEHHVQEEEQAGGMFDRAARSELDMEELGAELEQRKLELMDDETTDEGYDEAVEIVASDEDEDDEDLDDDLDDLDVDSTDDSGDRRR